ncbi:MAG: hypothetical protein ISR65_18615 [Bacteriovoracaceae bacterium]|nr:hypothetical protein [Bacteriovoracaceae bacterium]
MKLKMIALIFLFMVGGHQASAGQPNYICNDPTVKITFNFYPEHISMSRWLPSVSDYQSFASDITIEEGKTIFENYSVKVVFDGNIKQGKIQAQLFENDQLISPLTLNCNKYYLKKTPFQKKYLPRDVYKYVRKNLNQRYDSSIHAFKTNDSFAFKTYNQTLNYTISDIGDWFVVELTKKQRDLVLSYAKSSYSRLFELLDDNQLKIEGVTYARDWYHGHGNIGIVVKRKNIIVMLVIPFDNHVKFGDQHLDNVY